MGLEIANPAIESILRGLSMVAYCMVLRRTGKDNALDLEVWRATKRGVRNHPPSTHLFPVFLRPEEEGRED